MSLLSFTCGDQGQLKTNDLLLT